MPIPFHRPRRGWIALLFAVLVALPAQAQVSASFKLSEHAFNAGGRPAQGSIAQSASFRVSLDAIGDSVSMTGLSSASFGVGVGFVAPYPPPGEVTGLRFSDHQTLLWNPEKSTGSYDIYRSLVSTLSGLGYGTCSQQKLLDETSTDVDAPTTGTGYFYLVTAENLLAEEGTKGSNSAGIKRANPSPCP